jgi:hypothetical protein
VDRRAFGLLFGLILVLRVAICAQPAVTYDGLSYAIAADAVATGHDVYAATSRYNYSPVWSWIIAGLWRLAAGELMRFVLFVGLLLNGADAAASWLLLRIARAGPRSEAVEPRRLGLLFFANPVSVLVTCYLRQFDGLAILFLLGAVRLAQLADEREAAGASPARSRLLASLSLGVSLLVKHVTLLHPLVFFRRRRGGLPAALVALPYALFALSFVPHLSSLPAIRDNVILYGTGLRGARGQRPGGLQTYLSGGGNAVYFALFLLFVGGAILLGRRRDLPRACLLLSLAALAGAPGFAAQYLVWPVALGSLFPGAGYAVLSTLGALFIVSEARLAPLPIAFTAAAAWLGAFLWLVQEAWSALRARRYDDGAAAALQSSSTASG